MGLTIRAGTINNFGVALRGEKIPFLIVSDGDDFRLMNENGEIRFGGMILGKYQGLEPLLEFGRQHACCHIEYLREGNWVRFESTQ